MNADRNQPSDDLELHDEPEGNSETLHSFFGSPHDFLSVYAHCEQCDSNLHFNYFTDFSRNLTQEVSRCPECGTQARKMTHRLQ